MGKHAKALLWIAVIALAVLVGWFLWNFITGRSMAAPSGALVGAAAVVAAKERVAKAKKAAEDAAVAAEGDRLREEARRAAADAIIADDAARAAQAAVNGTDWDKGEDVLYNDLEV